MVALFQRWFLCSALACAGCISAPIDKTGGDLLVESLETCEMQGGKWAWLVDEGQVVTNRTNRVLVITLPEYLIQD